MKKFLTSLVLFAFLFQALSLIAPITRSVSADELSDVVDTVSCGSYTGVCCMRKANKTIDAKFPDLDLPFPFGVLNSVIGGVFNITARPILNAAFKGMNALIFDTLLDSAIKEDKPYCYEGDPQTINGKCVCADKHVQNLNQLCAAIKNNTEQRQCLRCVKGATGIWTGIGCLNTDLGALVREKITGTFVGIGGAMALLCIMYAAFVLQTSRGNPERIKKAKEMLRACITGLLLIIFSVLILKVIGVDILRIPGFER